MSRNLLRLTVLAALFILAILPVSAAPAPDQITLSCKAGAVVVNWITGTHEDYFLSADESTTTYGIPDNTSGSTTTVWSNGTFHAHLSYGTLAPTLLDSKTITCGVAGGESGATGETGSSEPPAPPPHWEGLVNDFGYDGRINATMADRYAVYCKAGQLQVWDSVTSSKVAAISYDDILALDNPDSVAIGDGVSLGSSNNTLMVVGPGSFTKDNIDTTRCVTGDYRGRNDR